MIGLSSWADGAAAEAGTGADDGYAGPDFSVPLFDVEAIGWDADARGALAAALTAVAANFADDPVVTHELRAKALAVAKQFDSTDAAVFTTNGLLKRGLPPRPMEGDGFSERRRLANLLWEASSRLRGAAASPASQEAGAFVVEIAAALDPRDVFKAEALERLRAEGAVPSWDGVIGSGDAGGEVSGDAGAVDAASLPGPGIGGSPAVPSRPARPRKSVVRVVVGGVEGAGTLAEVVALSAEGAAATANVRGVALGELPPIPALRRAIVSGIGHLPKPSVDWPAGAVLTIRAPAGRRSDAGDAAAVAAVVAAHGALSGRDPDPAVAFVGGIGPDGAITPVPEVANMVRGLRDGTVRLIGVPAEDGGSIADLGILGEVETLARIQILGLETVADALALAESPRRADLREAVELFAEFQALSGEQPVAKLLANRVVQGRLREIVRLAPNHLSARHLLLVALHREGGRLSLGGSRLALDRVVETLQRAEQAGAASDALLTPSTADACSECLFRLQNLRPKLHPEATEYADALSRFVEAFKEYSKTRQPGSARARALRAEMADARRVLAAAADRMRHREKEQVSPPNRG